MRWIAGVLFAVLGWAIVLTGSSEAQPKSKTKYTYYTIKGKSARNLYQQMVSRGPHVGGERALAATSVTTQQTGDLSGSSRCRVKNYRLSLDFTIRLPRVRSEKALSPRLRKNWKAFYRFVRRHEQRHRAIWIGCAKRIERQVRGLRSKSCRTVDRKANAIFRSMSKACEKKHDAFDTAEQKRLARHPLVVAAKRAPRVRKKKSRQARRQKKQTTRVRGMTGGRAADDNF